MGRELELHLEWLHVSVNGAQGCGPNVEHEFYCCFLQRTFGQPFHPYWKVVIQHCQMTSLLSKQSNSGKEEQSPSLLLWPSEPHQHYHCWALTWRLGLRIGWAVFTLPFWKLAVYELAVSCLADFLQEPEAVSERNINCLNFFFK